MHKRTDGLAVEFKYGVSGRGGKFDDIYDDEVGVYRRTCTSKKIDYFFSITRKFGKKKVSSPLNTTLTTLGSLFPGVYVASCHVPLYACSRSGSMRQYSHSDPCAQAPTGEYPGTIPVCSSPYSSSIVTFCGNAEAGLSWVDRARRGRRMMGGLYLR